VETQNCDLSELDKLVPNMEKFVMDKHPPNNYLTKRERECLLHTAHGKSAKSIAKILGISNRTVESYIKHLKMKLHSNNKADLIDNAIKSGLIEIITKIVIDFKDC
jgi:DNA-binding CsgD family transcriptional regulator